MRKNTKIYRKKVQKGGKQNKRVKILKNKEKNIKNLCN